MVNAGIYSVLLKRYGSQGWWPINGNYSGKKILSSSEKLEVCIGAILAQSTSWKNVEKALEALRKRSLLDRKKLLGLKAAELASCIKSSGYHNQKARKLQEFARFTGKVTRKNLLSIWGIGRETADSILLYAYNKPVFVIDAYTKRIMSRVGVCNENIGYDELQQLFTSALPANPSLFKEYHALLVQHAKQHCKKKPECRGCPLLKRCNYGLLAGSYKPEALSIRLKLPASSL